MKRSTHSDIRIGISGWRYEPWRGVFYPKGLNQKKELWFASRWVNSIEINGSFYSLQSPYSYQHWYKETPKDFVFSIKGNRYITHIKRLNDIKQPLANFFASGVLHLKEKLGPFLWQFPPSFVYDPKKLESFFKLLPKTVTEAAKLARTAKMVKASFPDTAKKSSQRLRHCIEIRNYSFENPEFIELTRQYQIALVFADTAGRWPFLEDITSDFIYVRLHGEEELYSSGYGTPSLRFWAKRIEPWSSGHEAKHAFSISEEKPPNLARDVYVYFDNDIKVHAPFDAQKLSQILIKNIISKAK